MALAKTNRNKIFTTPAGWCKRLEDGKVLGPFSTKTEAENAYLGISNAGNKVSKKEEKKSEKTDVSMLNKV
jgi:hypothetical protein